jgi:hypothetical protein
LGFVQLVLQKSLVLGWVWFSSFCKNDQCRLGFGSARSAKIARAPHWLWFASFSQIAGAAFPSTRAAHRFSHAGATTWRLPRALDITLVRYLFYPVCAKMARGI